MKPDLSSINQEQLSGEEAAPGLFEDIMEWLPEKHRASYTRFICSIKRLDEDDPVMKCILAMGVLTLLIRQAPAEVARQLGEFQRTVEELLTETQRSNAQLLASLQIRTAELEAINKRLISQTHLNQMAGDFAEILENRVALCLNPIAADKVDVLERKVESIDKWLDHLIRKATEFIRTVNDLEPTISKELRRLKEVGVTLERAVHQSATELLTDEAKRRPWRWIAWTTVSCTALIVCSGLMGAWINHLVEHQDRSISQQEVTATAGN